MIRLGLAAKEKATEITKYCYRHHIKKVFLLSPKKFLFPCFFLNVENIDYEEIIQYKFFYRLLQEINSQTLIVINECLRTQNRYDLTYNCIRNFLNQTSHQIIFQYLPLIDKQDDFMILFDFDTRSRWKREPFNSALFSENDIAGDRKIVQFIPRKIETDEKTKIVYAKEKERLFSKIGLKDPHTIPRNLYLMSGKAKLSQVKKDHYYIGRNARLKIPTLQTYKEDHYPHMYTVFEFCHNFIDFADFITLSGQSCFEVFTTDLKVDGWYFDRYQQWIERIADAYTAILGQNCLSRVA